MNTSEHIHKDMRIGIIGGGFAGPTAALALAKEGFTNIKIFERSEEIRSKGFGIGLAGNGRHILHTLGVEIEDSPSIRELTHLKTCDAAGRVLYDLPVPQVKDHLSYLIAREDLHQAIFKAVSTQDAITVVPHHQVVSVAHHEGKERITFEDKTVEECDLVIGAGGINSVVRSTLYSDATQTFSDWSTWWFWGTGELEQKQPHAYVGPGATIGMFPLAGNQHFFTCNFFGTPDSVMRGDVETMRSYLESKLQVFENIPDIKKSVLQAENYMASRTSMINVKQSYCGHAVLIGDAEHAFSPILGLGTTLAVEDAFVLAQELAAKSDSKAGVTEALEAYDKRRNKRIKRVQFASGMVWNGVNITKGWQQTRQRLGAYLFPSFLVSILYRLLVQQKL